MATFRPYYSYPQTQPGSQESLTSSSGTAPMTSASEGASQATADTDYVSHMGHSPRTATQSSKHVAPHFHAQGIPHASSIDTNKVHQRVQTPEGQVDASRGPDSALTSPMSLTTPVNSHKRMASGQLKSVEYGQQTSPGDASRAMNSIRAGSVGSSGSRASEAAANLKDRLSYAMAKVQHGWEHHNIDQVERLAAAAISPRTVVSPRYTNGHAHVASPRSAGFPSRVITDQMHGHRVPMNDPAIRSAPLMRPRGDGSSSDGSMSPPAKRRPVHDSVVSHHGPASPPAPRNSLAPAVPFGGPISPNRHRHQQNRTHARHGSSASQDLATSPSRRHPSTPKGPHHRPATIRTQTQTAQAEQEAMDALLLMGSPSNSAFPRGSQHSSAAQSPRHRSFHPTNAPRAALQYRSESNESIESVGGMRRDPAALAEIMRRRGTVLDQIEAES